MTRTFFKFLVIVCPIVITSFTACDRDRYTDIPSTVAGTWTLTKYGKDYNANRALEANETTTAVAAGIDEIVSYRRNGVYTIASTSSGDKKGTWYEINGKIYTVVGADTSASLIISFTDQQLVTLCNDSSVNGMWHVYKK